jgi:hypothetical protein
MKKLSILITMFWLILSSSSLAATTKSEWVIEQKYSEIGDHKVYLSADAVKIVCPKQGFQVSAKAPDWDAYCYRLDSKKLWIGKFNVFTGDLLVNPFAVPKYSFEPLRPDTDTVYNGFECASFLSDKENSVVYGSKTISISPMACEFLCRYFNVPRMHEVPMFRRIEAAKRSPLVLANDNDQARLTENVLRDQRYKSRVILSTSSVKKISYKSSDFDLPKNFQHTSQAGDIGVTGAQRSQIGAALDELGFSSDYVRNEKKQK